MKLFAAVFTALCLGACAIVPTDVLRPVTASLMRSDGGLGRIFNPAALISQVSLARPNDAETWLECIVATERSSADAAEQFRLRNPGPEGEALRRESLDHYSRMMALYRKWMEASSPALTASEIAERRRVYEGRYDEPTELEPAQWRGDSCVAWL